MSAATEDTEPTVGESAAKQGGRRWARGILVVGVIAAFVAIIFFGFRWVEANERVRTARDGVESAGRLLDVVEEDVLVVDAAVQADITSEIATQSAEAIELTGSITERLNEAREMIETSLPDLPEEDIPMAEALLESADAREEMMAEAPVILEANVKAARAIPFADRALEEIKAAEELVAQAAAEFNKHTEAGVRASGTASAKAEERLTAARSLLTSATAEFPEADYSAFTEYVDAKLELVSLSKKIDQLWLDEKIEESNKQLEAYNKRDAEVVAMAKALPGSVRDPIADAYEAITDEAVDRYFEARSRARSAGDRVEELRGAAATG